MSVSCNWNSLIKACFVCASNAMMAPPEKIKIWKSPLAKSPLENEELGKRFTAINYTGTNSVWQVLIAKNLHQACSVTIDVRPKEVEKKRLSSLE